MFEKHFGHNESEAVLVGNRPATIMNPTIDEQVIAAAYPNDPMAAVYDIRRDSCAVCPPCDRLQSP